MPVQIRGTVLTLRRVDAYHALTLVAVSCQYVAIAFFVIRVG